ncbi:hypothetical protein GQ53DRAFT_756196 [Thozetella sp. PMI_491]|nr:hypothetical protein GQ53DRAFT_756196 [Thozetella sp. PMI_491]
MRSRKYPLRDASQQKRVAQGVLFKPSDGRLQAGGASPAAPFNPQCRPRDSDRESRAGGAASLLFTAPSYIVTSCIANMV